MYSIILKKLLRISGNVWHILRYVKERCTAHRERQGCIRSLYSDILLYVFSREKRDKELDKETKEIGLKPLQPWFVASASLIAKSISVPLFCMFRIFT